MILNYRITENKTIFDYIIENDEELEGMGETKMLSLINKKGNVYFDYPVKNPHNDILAYMSIIIFYPFIKNNLTFTFSLSNRFVNNLKKEFKNLNVYYHNIDYDKYNGKNILIPMGGGVDSTSIMCLFKDAYLYHQKGKETVVCNLIC